MARTVLFVAAEAREFSGLLRRTGGTQLHWPLPFARSADWNGARLLMVANGPGPRLAALATQTALRMEPVDAVVSTGLCGALVPGLDVGNIVVAASVVEERGRVVASPLQPETSRPFRSVSVLSIDRVAITASDKRSLRETGAVAVEMETAGVAASASERKLPFFCVRSVSDTASEELVLNFNACRDSQGRFSRVRIVAAVLRRPLSGVPALMRIDRNSRAAAESLGDFLADCRF